MPATFFSSHRSRSVVLASALALLTLLAGCASDEGESATTLDFAKPDEPAPDFTLPTLDDETVRLADLSGRPVVVNFWASWCNPCRQEFPLLVEALVEHEDDDLAVVGVTYKDIESDSREFAREVGATWPLAVDENGEVAAAYGVRAIPQTFFVDRDGIIRARVFGFSSEEALEEPLRTILR